MKISVREIIKMKEIYPRGQKGVSLHKVADYADAIESGSRFPPPVVCEIGKRYVIVDGEHTRAAYALLSAHSQEYDEIEVLNLGEITVEKAIEEAIRRNSEHGMAFTPEDRVRLVQKLTEGGREAKYISGLMHMTPGKIRNVLSTSATYMGTGKNARPENHSASLPDWLSFFRQRLLKGTLDIEREDVRTELVHVRDLIDRMLAELEVKA